MPTKKIPAEPGPDEPAELVLDLSTFNAAERLECQVQFDTAFGDLMRYIRESWNPDREGPMASAVVARDGTRWFPDQIIQYMLWVQEKRTRPDAELSEFDELPLAALNGAHVAGLLGKATRTSTASRRSRRQPSSSTSSTAE